MTGRFSAHVIRIALSKEPKDTNEKISSFRQENGLTLPMGRDEDHKLYDYTETKNIPVTVIVDRFGNAVFLQVGSFRTSDDLRRTLNAFLGDQYTETAILHSVPADTSIGVLYFPRGIYTVIPKYNNGRI